MLKAQQFKTYEGARKRALFENQHCDNKYRYAVVRCLNGVADHSPFNALKFKEYTYRLERKFRP